MDQTTLWVIGIGVVAAIIVLAVAGGLLFAWSSRERARRDRRIERESEYPRISSRPAAVAQPARPRPLLEWGDMVWEAPQHLPEVTELPDCPLCKQKISVHENFSCPSCGTNYHRQHWDEYGATCMVCGRKEPT